jgi:hypothetical protein
MKIKKKIEAIDTLANKHKIILSELNTNHNKIKDLENDIAKYKNELKTNIDIIIYNNLTNKIQDLTKEIETYKTKRKTYFINSAPLIFDYNNSDLNFRKIKNNTNINIPIKTKKECFDEFLKLNDTNYNFKNLKENNVFCNDCKIYKKLKDSESKLICPICGEITDVIIENDKPSIKDPPPETRQYEYKKFGHFCNWLSKIQGKESCEIHPDVYIMIQNELKLERIYDYTLIDDKDIKRYLKKYIHLGYDKYFNHSIHIYMKISGICPIILTLEQEEIYKRLFLLIQEPYHLYKDSRPNFGSYSYLIYKLAQLMNHESLCKKMKLLKDKTKLHKLDMIWEKICAHNGGESKGWIFIPTY